MKITKEFLKEHNACSNSYKWVVENGLIDLNHEKFIKKLMKADRFSDANWLITKLFDRTQNIKYAVNAAELVLDIFEQNYPGNNRPKLAIEAAKKYLADPNIINADAAASAATAASAAASAAAYAAYATAYTAYAMAYAAYAADAVASAAAADNSKETGIINFGLQLLKNL
jgi:hypothetical protein